jgi:membrane protease YdiL (CAAX protease family)
LTPDTPEPGPVEEPPAGTPPRLGTGYFTIEGRAAPGLFVVGWLATILGLGIAIVGWLAGGGTGGLIVLGVGLASLSVGLLAAAGSQAIERRARGGHAYAGPSPILLFAASIPVTYLVLLVVGAPLAALGADPARPVVELLLVGIQAVVYIALVALLVVGVGALTWREMGFGRSARGALEDLAWGAVFAGPVIGITIVVSALLVGILQVAPEGPLPPTGEPSGLVLHLIAGAILAPLGEEVVFRGVATTAWARSFGARAGIVRSALFFAVVHVLLVGGASLGEAAALAVVGFAARLPVALALGWVFLRRRSIYASIGLHAAFNAVLIVLSEAAASAGAATALG